MSELLAKENTCGQQLLKLTSRGSSILAELQRLSQNIPKIFIENSAESQKYHEILFDFQYLQHIDEFEDKIQQDMSLVELDNHIRENYLDLLDRFYTLYESVYLFYSDILEVLEEIFDGAFIQYSFENLLQHSEGKKLIAEIFYLYGTMLLLMDKLIPGPIRERIIIAYYRYKGGFSAITNINEVCKLFKATGYLPSSYTGGQEVRPQYYPEDYFERFSFDEDMMEAIVNTVKDGDIYQNLAAYPAPEHRSFALASQGAILYVILYFVPDILIEKKAKMREIVDKHFYDNWVITFYLGHYVDLTVDWKNYKAASKALNNTLDFDYIEDLTVFFHEQLEESYKKCEGFLIDGLLTEEYALEKSKQLINCVRSSNITLRWLMLHQKSNMQQVRDIILNGLENKDILSLLLIASKFESKLQKCFENLLATKQERWDADKEQAVDRMKEISECFGGARGLGKIGNDESYKIWFEQMAKQISELNMGENVYTSRKISQLTKALEDIEQYEALNSNYTIKHYLDETKKDLKHMTKISSIQPEYLTHISLISDISYMWKCLPDYIELMQNKIKKHPQVALLLKSTFMKLSCILNTPMIRIIQAESPDINSVSKYYSQELIKFVKNVLQIIPQEVFAVLEDIIILLTEKLATIPPKFNKNDLKNLAQPQERFEMANNTNRISLLTESILSMETYLIGVIEVNPKEILDEGIRKELIKLICRILDRNLKFKTGTVNEFYDKLKVLSQNLAGFKQSVEYIQDFISAYGLKIFHEEFDRLITCYIDMEQSAFLSGSLDFEDMWYDDDIPLPDIERNKKYGSVNFMGRLLNQILQLTDSKNTVYIEQSMGFFQSGTGQEIINLKSLGLMYKCIGVSGMSGLDQFLGFHISTTMKGVIKLMKKKTKQNQQYLKHAFQNVSNLTAFQDEQNKIYSQLKKDNDSLLQGLVQPLQKIGQLILLRKIICLQLQLMAKVGSKRLFLCLENLNNGIINDVTNRVYDEVMSEADIAKENTIIYESSKLCNFVGMTDAQKKVYLTPDYIEALPLLLFLCTQNIIPYCDYDARINTVVKKQLDGGYKKHGIYDSLQPTYFMYGILSLLNQFHPNNKDVYMGFMAHQIKSQLNNFSQENKKGNIDQVGDMFLYITIYDNLLNISGDAKQAQINQLVPIELINTNFQK